MSGFDSSKIYVEYCSRVNQYLEEYFNIWSESRTTTSDMISIDDDGLVSVEGNVGLKPKFDKITLPVRFKKTHTFSIHANRSLRHLAGSPEIVTGHFDCSETNIIDLIGAPKYVGGVFYCHNTPIKSLVGAPDSIGETFACSSTNISDLTGCPKSGDRLLCPSNISLLQICHLNYQTMSVLDRGEFNSELSVLLTRYLNSGSKGVLALASELISLGYERQARL